MDKLLAEIRSCQLCAEELENGVRPVIAASLYSKVIIIGQAPGSKVHASGKPWDDKSGETLRSWLMVDEDEFYNVDNFAIVPMGFCYPGKGRSGDLPPKKICAPTWHPQLLSQFKNVELVLVIGKYAQDYYLNSSYPTLTENVKNFRDFLPKFLPLPHPSPRNNIWMAKNGWFKEEVIPILQKIVLNKLKGKS